MNDHCGGCNHLLDVCKPVYPNERYGLLCKNCHRFALDCETSIRKALEFAEALSVLESIMTRDQRPVN